MRIVQINKMDTAIDSNHESVFRAYQILEKVKYYLEMNVPTSIILELIEEMEDTR